jgi:hypothetical protein
MGTEEAYLVVFDRRAKLGWDEKIWQKEMDGLVVWGC